jgi:hypothetical protein
MKISYLFRTSALALILLTIGTPRSSRASFYQLDDGSAEDAAGITGNPGGADLIGLNQFSVIGGMDMIGSVEIAWGSPFHPDPSLNGLAYTAAVWSDPNLDGDPSDAVLLATAPGIISGAGTDTFDITTFSSCIPVTQSFFVGFLLTQNPNQFPAALDETNPLTGRSFVAGANAGSGDLANLNNNTLVPLSPLDAFLPANFMIRADPWTAVPEPSTLALLAIGGVGVLVSAIRQSWRRVA